MKVWLANDGLKAFFGDQIYHRPDCLYNLMTCLTFFSVLDYVAWRAMFYRDWGNI